VTEIRLDELTAEHLGKHVRELDGQNMAAGVQRRGWKAVAGRLTSVRHFYDRPQKYTSKGKPTGLAPVMHTSLIVETGRDQNGAVHREILAPSTQKVDLNQ
jgi:hypothetical protein